MFGTSCEPERRMDTALVVDPLQATVRATPIGYADDFALIRADDVRPMSSTARRSPIRMKRKIVVSEFMTLDGVMEDPGGSEHAPFGGWAFKFERGSEGDRFKLDELMAADALLLGRKTYDGFSAAWPSIEDEHGFAERMNALPKYVVSVDALRAHLERDRDRARRDRGSRRQPARGGLAAAACRRSSSVGSSTRCVSSCIRPRSATGKKLFETPSDFTLVSARAVGAGDPRHAREKEGAAGATAS